MTILNQSEIMEQVSGISVGWAFGIFGLAFFFFAILFAVCCDLEEGGIFLGFIASFFITMIICAIWSPKMAPTGRYEYEVILDESYSATELYKNYDVIEQRGQIWVIQDKVV